MDELTQRGIAALKAGDRAAARQLLAAAVKQNQDNALAWLWLTGTLDSDEERLTCLRQVLRIDPTNQAAARGMAQIQERRVQAAARPAAPVVREEAPREEAVAPARTAAVETVPPTAPDDSSEKAQPVVVETAPPAVEQPAAVTAPAAPARRSKARAASAAERPIFRTRPSLVPALLCFWLFFFGAVALAALLNGVPEVGLPLAGIVGLLLEIVVIYVVIRNYTVRYELTSQQLTLRFRGKRAVIAIGDILGAECTQSFFQQLLGIGNIDIEATVDGQLTHLRMRGIPQCHQRAEQILSLVKGQV